MLHGLKGERATLSEVIQRLGFGEVPISALSSEVPKFDLDGSRSAIAPWGKLLFDNQRAVALEWMNEAVAIDSSILPSPPLDPFSSREFRMEHRDGQLFVYSIGPNLADEHGAFEPKQWMKGGPEDVGGSTWDLPLRRQQPRPQDEQPPRSESPP